MNNKIKQLEIVFRLYTKFNKITELIAINFCLHIIFNSLVLCLLCVCIYMCMYGKNIYIYI